MKAEWLAFLSAVQFLTRLPVPNPGWEDGRLDRAAKWFPLVGVLVGLICAAVVWFGSALLDQSLDVAILLASLAAILVAGAMHEDGLADTVDGLGGGRDRAHMLAIMKDSSIGAFGAIALIFAISLRFLLYRDAAASSLEPLILLVAIFVAGHSISRLAMLGIVWSIDYARDEETAKVAPMTGVASRTDWTVAAITGVVAIVPIFYIHGIEAVGFCLVFTMIAMVGLRALYLRKLGGWTGDTAGATQVICEIAFLIGLTAWI